MLSTKKLKRRAQEGPRGTVWVNPSTPRLEVWMSLRVNPERAVRPAVKSYPPRSRIVNFLYKKVECLRPGSGSSLFGGPDEEERKEWKNGSLSVGAARP